MFFLWVRQHIHILDRQLKANQSLSARETLKKMTHLPNASHRHRLCVARQICSHLLLDHLSAPDLRGSVKQDEQHCIARHVRRVHLQCFLNHAFFSDEIPSSRKVFVFECLIRQMCACIIPTSHAVVGCKRASRQ